MSYDPWALKPMEILHHMFRDGKDKIKYLASLEQIIGILLVDFITVYFAEQIRDFHRKNVV